MPRPIDIVADSLGRWRAMYEDGSLGPPLTLDEMLDLLPHLAPAPDGDDELVGKAAGALFRPGEVPPAPFGGGKWNEMLRLEFTGLYRWGSRLMD